MDWKTIINWTKKSDLNWGLIDIQSTPNVPTLLSYNLDKEWDYSTIRKD